MQYRKHACIFTIVSAHLVALTNLANAQQPGAAVVVQDANNRSVSYTTDVVAIVGESNRPFDRQLLHGAIKANINGLLLIQQDGKYRFSAETNGSVRVTINDKEVLTADNGVQGWVESEAVELQAGFVAIQVEFATADSPDFRLFWSGPNFELTEPVGGRFLFHKPSDDGQQHSFREYAGDIAQAYRCNACHEYDGRPSLAAPSLANLSAETMHQTWLVDWLSLTDKAARHCPTYGFDKQQAATIASELMPDSQKHESKETAKSKGEANNGEVLFASLGCLACHSVQQIDGETLGTTSDFGGGDLSQVAVKRPVDFFVRWLKSPEKINPHHRMPVFELNKNERADLAAYLATLGAAEETSTSKAPSQEITGTESTPTGKQLISDANCAACHQIPGFTAKPANTIKTWDVPCSSSANPRSGVSNATRPQFKISTTDQQRLRQYIKKSQSVLQQNRTKRPNTSPDQTAHELLTENNCFACHSRGINDGTVLSETATSVVEAYSKLAGQYAALIPPSLNQVGDKLNDEGLRNAIRRDNKPLRPWLRIRMPRFRLTDAEIQTLVQHFANHDRLPDSANKETKLGDDDNSGNDSPDHKTQAEIHNGGRLIGANGFNCVSCHSLGEYVPAAAPISSRGPNLAAVVGRVRPEWFARWVRNPIRIVPNVEMPSITVPVKGVLDDDLDRQVSAIWSTIRDPKFKIPTILPFRVLRQTGTDKQARAIVLTDVLRLQHPDRELETFLKPFAIGFSNRQNVLMDLSPGGLSGWWIGDLAGQINDGKRWHWRATVHNLLAPSGPAQPKRTSDITLRDENKKWQQPLRQTADGRESQFITRADSWRHTDGGVELKYRLRFETANGATSLSVRRLFSPQNIAETGFKQTLECALDPKSDNGLTTKVRLDVAPGVGTDSDRSFSVSTDRTTLILATSAFVQIETNGYKFENDGSIEFDLGKSNQQPLRLLYGTDASVDYFASAATHTTKSPQKPRPMNVVPGFDGTLLPIDEPFMPTGLSWADNGTLFVASLDGRVWRVIDSDADGLPDHANLFSDELSTPYGIAANNEFVDVVDKTALLRLRDTNGDGTADETTTAAAGWGHTDDYHDWVVGLERDAYHNYYIAIPCQQDERSEPAAYLRGKVLQLLPRDTTDDQPELFSIQKLTGGHRFPHGIARNRDGALFVTDNQGNYNPFNELNHVVTGRRFGFINRLEQKPEFKPTLTPPAINIPHPWTRSVNGICFLESPMNPTRPKAAGGNGGSANQKRFGPFEGHIVGCEYDTRRLVRMSLQRIGDEYQGAVYPFSYTTPPDGPRIPGPIVCEIGPDGALYIGSLRESGWGGGKNTGEIVRLAPNLGELPTGIAEIRATADGFQIEFTGPVNPSLAANLRNYQVMSYRRISTPKYGGDDVDRREEKVTSVRLESDRLIRIRFQDELRLGHVYEFRLQSLSVSDEEFFPAEGYYTLNHLLD